MLHCWHKTQLPGKGLVIRYDGEICCQCGATWSEHHRKPISGHGPYCPDTAIIAKSDGPCKPQSADALTKKEDGQ